MLLHEVPGAMERPAHCAVIVRRENSTTTVEIPPVELSPLVIAGGILLSMTLLLFFVTGIGLFYTGEPFLVLKYIAPDPNHPVFPITVKRAIPLSVPIWGLILWIGAHELNAIFRPGLLRERMTFQDGGIIHERRYLWKKEITHFLSDSVRGFQVQPEDGEGRPSSLHIEGRGQSDAVGEYLRAADREWLASVGNALLRAV